MSRERREIGGEHRPGRGGMRPRFPTLVYVALTLIVAALIAAIIAGVVVTLQAEHENRQLLHHLFPPGGHAVASASHVSHGGHTGQTH
jgi:hypothetical protein